MKKRLIAILMMTVMTASLMTGCAKSVGRVLQKAGNSLAGEEGTTTDSTGEATDADAQDGSKEAGTDAAGDKTAPEGTDVTGEEMMGGESLDMAGFLPDILDYSDRFIIGNQYIYYIEDDETYTKVLSLDENENIAGCAGDDEYFFVLIRTFGDKSGYDLYFWHDGDPVGTTPINVDESVYISRIAVLDHHFYYTYYGGVENDNVHCYYDPEGDGFMEDEDMEYLGRSLSKYKGRDLNIVGSSSDIPKMLSQVGVIYAKDEDAGLVYTFDRDGVELGCFDQVLDNVSFSEYHEDYLFGQSYEYDGNGMATSLYDMMYDARTGESVELFRRDVKDADVDILTIKDGYLYYYKENRSEYGDLLSRSVYREGINDIWDNVRDAQLIYTVEEYPGVESSYGNYNMHAYDNMGISILTNRLYFLDFFADNSDGYLGDVMWCYVNMDGDRIGKRAVTDCFERHEDYADWGTVKTVYDVRRDDTDDFIYFKAKREEFRFHPSVKNADALNKCMEEAEEYDKKAAEEIAESAKRDILGEDSDEDPDWYKNQVGFGFSHERTFGCVKPLGAKYVQLLFNDYDYFGGAHGMPYEMYYLFDTDTGERKTIKDFYKGNEEQFKKLVVDASIQDWKKDKDYKYYELYDPSQESEQRKDFETYVNFDMDIEFTEKGIMVYYPPYAVAPFASGFVGVDIPYSDLGFSLE